ncbi:NAD(P)-dependent oxidoreductase [Puniceicoccales bacterium CK1056]|uniref:NAD(P)-dependent oxidoreductase n=1 Tax=Oceanipulchritudo coccoides TaxID=2706888 RepID=A0A6B2M3Q2_9BACT|nr:NAD(P)-dependent oxidoreductase [Oceanipulchritudo coccoides]NDV63046.1 NAD(P)-dependent oxidoreductase [Oceanipulchritudo coccoides]
MKIFFTGASSFTGFWFAKTLAEAGHEVTGTFTRAGLGEYKDLYHTRTELLLPLIKPVWNCRMGSEEMLEALGAQDYDLLCLHGAVVGNHKAPDFPVMDAVQQNTLNLDEVLKVAKRAGVKSVIHTSSYFEADTGKGTKPLEAFSPYALSKTLTWHIVRFACYQAKMPLGKFVVANPFGPYEKGGFTTYLAKSWLAGEVPVVKSPDYVRDNVPVELMALCYLEFSKRIQANPHANEKMDPGYFDEPQGQFAKRFSMQMHGRLESECSVRFASQEDFSEPKIRTNSIKATSIVSDWSEDLFWDGLAAYYRC